MLIFNCKVALRNIWKNKTFSFVNIFGLALSVACCLVLAIYLLSELSYDRFHKNYRQIFRITSTQIQAGNPYEVAVTPGPLAPALQKDLPAMINAARVGSWGGLLKVNDQTVESNEILLTDHSFLEIFDFEIVKGDTANMLKGPDDMVITESMASRLFGADWRSRSDLFSSVISLADQKDFRLSGVVKDLPYNSSIRFDALLPLQWLLSTDKWSNQWNSNNYHTYLQLHEGTITREFEKKATALLHKNNPDIKDQLKLQPLKDQYLYSDFDFSTDWGKRSNIVYVRIFGAVGILLLVIACVNFINLSLARSITRSLEVGVKKVVGASRKQMVTQFLTESVLMAFISGLIGLTLIKLSVPFITTITGDDIISGFPIQFLIIVFVAIVVVIGLLAGLYPAFVLSGYRPISILKAPTRISGKKFFWKSLVVFQFGTSIALMICTSIMYNQLKFVQHKDLGFNKDQLISIRMKGKLRENPANLKNALQQQHDISNVALATMGMANVENSNWVNWEGKAANDSFLITQANVDPDFIPALGMSLIAGNNFSKQITNDTANFIVNEAAVERMGYTVQNAPGKQIEFWGAKGRIIGVVKNFHFKSFNSGIAPFLFRYQPQENYYVMFAKISSANQASTIAKISAIYKNFEPDFPISYSFVNEDLTALYQNEQKTTTLMIIFSALTVMIGCMGLFGLTTFAASQRTREIGIRKVLGATSASIAYLISREFIKTVLIAAVIAVPVAAYISSRWLENFTYRINPAWWIFALVCLIVMAFALITTGLQALKAANANPSDALRKS